MAGIKAGPAATLSIEIIAEIARLQADLDRVKRLVRDASGDIAKHAKAANDNLSNLNSGLSKSAPSAKQAAFGMKNLVFQLQDLGVQGAMAAASSEPLKGLFMALIMQGPQIKDAIDQTGKSLFGLAAGFAAAHPLLLALIAALGLAYGAFKLFSSEVAKSGELEAYAKSLGLTADEMKDLKDVTVTAGDVFKGLWRTIDQGLGTSKIFATIKTWAVDAFSAALDYAKSFAAGTYAAVVGTANAIMALGRAAKKAITGDFGGALTSLVQDNPLDGFSKAFRDASKAIDGFFKDVGRNSIAAAKERIAAQASSIIDKRKIEKEGKEKGSFLADVMSGAFLSRFALEMAQHPIVDMEKIFSGQTISDVMRQQEQAQREKQEGDERLKRFYADWATDLRQIFLTAVNDFADIIGGRFGEAIARMASVLDRFAPGVSAALGKLFEKLDSTLGGILKLGGIGGIAAGVTGGSGLGGVVGGALGGKLGEKFLSKGLESISKGLGEFAGPIGAIAGGILGGVVGGLFKKVKKASATVEIMAGEAMMTSLTGNSSKLKAVAGSLADSLIGGLSSIADQLGGMLGDGVRISIGKRKDSYRVDVAGLGRTKNMPSFETEEEAIQYAIQQAILQGAITGLRAGTERLIKGQGDLEVQLQKALSFESVFRELAQQANPAKAAIDDITKQFAALRAIFEEAGASAEDYAQLQELMAIKQREVIEQAFEPIRTMLDDLKSKADEAGQAVRDAFDQVMQSEAEAIQAYQDALARQRQAANDNLSAAQQAVADAQEALRAAQEDVLRKRADSLEDMIDKVKDGMQSLKDQAADFADAAQRLREFAKGSTATTLGGLRAQFAGLVARGRAGDLTAMQELPGVGEALRDAVTASATDRVSMMIELAKINADALSVAGVADSRKSMAEKQLAAAEKQVSTLEAQLAATQKQIDELNNVGKNILSVAEATAQLQTAQQAEAAAQAQVDALGTVSEDVLSVADALAQMQTAVAAADQARAQMALMTELNETQTSFADAVAAYEAAKAERDDLLRQITVAGFADLITAQQKTGNQLISALQEVASTAQQARTQAADAIAAAQAAAAAAAAARIANDNLAWLNGVPMFASGGIHAGGLRIVGEEGPELEATGPARYYNASDTAALLGGDASAEVRSLREDMRRDREFTQRALLQITKNTGKTSDHLQRWDGEGLPPEREVA